ncbi:hypothetical protein HYPBUDRAFT_113652, partial [Hyphopichia burtonii NRRL Y-1933]
RQVIFLWPLKNCNNFNSRNERLHKMFLLKMLVIFLIATKLFESSFDPSSYLAEQTIP